MIDMHSHILPGIDDGAKTIEESIEMTKIAVANGTTVIAATPHVIEGKWLPDWAVIVKLCAELNTELKKAKLNLMVTPGGEVALNMDILELVTGPGPYCINGGKYMLVELPATHIPHYTDDFFFTLQTRGITPILAHPERHPEIAQHPKLVLDWVNKGILMQMNGPSLVGKMGERAMKTAETLLISNLIHFFGSDAHSPKSRTPRLGDAEEKAKSLVGYEMTQQILYTNPLKLINGEDIITPNVEEIRKLREPGIIKKIWAILK